MNVLKNQRIGFFAYIIVAIMTFVALFFYVSNVNAPYYEDMDVSVLTIIICALAAVVGVIVISVIAKGKIAGIIMDVLRVASTSLIIVAGARFIGMRVESFGYIFGSNLELGNDAAFSAGGQAIVVIIIFIVTWFLSVIASFLRVGQK
jgi:hypothetical protein